MINIIGALFPGGTGFDTNHCFVTHVSSYRLFHLITQSVLAFKNISTSCKNGEERNARGMCLLKLSSLLTSQRVLKHNAIRNKEQDAT